MKKKFILIQFIIVLFCIFIAGCSEKKETTRYIEGDVIEFGTALIERDTKLEWIVLECQNDRALLISKNIIEYRNFHSKTKTNIEWQNSDICAWLNNDFYNGAFSEEEKAKVLEYEIQTKNYGSETSDSTQNRVFLFNIQEVKKYVTGKKYAETTIEDSSKGWLLRDKAENQSHIAYVNEEGNIIDDFGAVMDSVQGIRPAMWIKIESLE